MALIQYVDRSKLEQLLKQQNRSGTMDAGTAAEIGKELGVDWSLD